MYIAPIGDLRTALLKGRLGDLNPFPWVMMTGNCVGWIFYGYYLEPRDAFIVASNMPGFMISLWLNFGAAKLQYKELWENSFNKNTTAGINNNHSNTTTTKSCGLDQERQIPPTPPPPPLQSQTGLLPSPSSKHGKDSCNDDDDEAIANGVIHHHQQQSQLLPPPKQRIILPPTPPLPRENQPEEQWPSGGRRRRQHWKRRLQKNNKKKKKNKSRFNPEEQLISVPQEEGLFRVLSVWLAVVIVVHWIGQSRQAAVRTIGIVVNMNLIFFYGAPLQTMQRVIFVDRHSNTVHRPTMYTSLACSSFNFLYGVAKLDPLMMLPNAVGFVMGLLQCLLCLCFPRREVVLHDDDDDDNNDEQILAEEQPPIQEHHEQQEQLLPQSHLSPPVEEEEKEEVGIPRVPPDYDRHNLVPVV